MARKTNDNQRVTNSVKDYTIRYGDRVWTITAQNFGAQPLFKVYRIEGDINRLEDLVAGIGELLAANGIEGRRIELEV